MRLLRHSVLLPLLTIGLLLLAGCGFHLRGSFEVPTEASPVYVTGSPTGPVNKVRLALRHADVTLVEEAAKAKTVIHVFKEDFDRRVLAVDGRGKAVEFELSYRLTFDIVDASGKELVPRQSLELKRNQINPETGIILGKIEEEAFIRADMEQDAVVRVLQRLRARLR